MKNQVLSEQVLYYRARAAEYDEWWQRTGRYDRGVEATERWCHEVTQVEDALRRFHPSGDVLELASGTGWWTQRLAPTASRLTCVDASPEMIALNRAHLLSKGYQNVRYVEADVFAWRPDTQYDVVFFSFWISHVPDHCFDHFWAMVAAVLRPGGRVFLIDSRAEESSTARDHQMPDAQGMQERRLNDGRSFRILKLYREPEELAQRLVRLSWRTDFHSTPTYFVYGSAYLTAPSRCLA